MKRTSHSMDGFTLVELVVVMTVFIVVLIITGNTFKTVLNNTQVTMGSEVSNMEGIVGLEMLRHDLQQAGVGLFNDTTNVPNYKEAKDFPYSKYNDAGNVPRAIVTDDNVDLADNTLVMSGTDYLAIKSVLSGDTDASQRGSYILSDGVPIVHGENDFVDGTDKLIAIDQSYDSTSNLTNSKVARRLVMVPNSDKYAFTYFASGNFSDEDGNAVDPTYYRPSGKGRYYLFGIYSDPASNNVFTLRAPFNRTDYFIRRVNGETPSSCSPDAGVLIKATMNQANGSFTPVPVLDCVADMQVVLEWGSPKENVATTYTGAGVDSLAKMELKLIKIYFLVQDGGRDLNFTNTNKAMVIGDPDDPLEPGAGVTAPVDLTTANKIHYRWKLKWVVVKPMNM